MGRLKDIIIGLHEEESKGSVVDWKTYTVIASPSEAHLYPGYPNYQQSLEEDSLADKNTSDSE
ncbi:hypothetical protein Daqu01_00278 [Deinococcus aquaticus]